LELETRPRLVETVATIRAKAVTNIFFYRKDIKKNILNRKINLASFRNRDKLYPVIFHSNLTRAASFPRTKGHEEKKIENNLTTFFMV